VIKEIPYDDIDAHVPFDECWNDEYN